MSQFARQLGLKISIEVSGVERLNEAQRALRQQLAANIPFLRQSGELRKAMDQLSTGATVFAKTGAPLQATRTLTQLMAVQKQARSEEDAAERQRVSGIITRAKLLAYDGEQAKAINLLTLANDKYGKSADNRLRFERELTRLRNAQDSAGRGDAAAAARAATRQEAAIAAQAILNSRAARGDPSLQIALLSQAQGQVTPGGRAFNSLERGLIGANEALASSADKAANAEKKKQDQINRLQAQPVNAQARYEQGLVSEAREVVGLAVKYKNYEGALAKIEAARSKVRAGSTADIKLQRQAADVLAQQANEKTFFDRIIEGAGAAATHLRRFLATAFFVAYAARQVGGIIYSTFVQPIEKLAEATFDATDNFRRMAIVLSGVTGSLRSARSLQEDIAHAGRGLPSTLLQQQEAVRGVLFTPAIARQAQLPGPARESALRSLLQTLQGLAVINPEQGLPGAQFAFREALAGQFRSTRTRFNISPQVVAASINKTVSDLTADPSLVPKAFEAFVKTFIGPDTIAEFQNLLSTQGLRFRGVMQEFFNLVGNQGIFDRVVGILRRINDRIEAGVRARPGSPDDLRPVAAQVDAALERVLDVLLKAADNILGSAVGRNIDIEGALKRGDIAELGKTAGDFINVLAKMTARIVILLGDLVDIGAKIARFTLGPQTTEETVGEIAKLETRLKLQRRIEGALQSPDVGAGSGSFVDPNTGEVFKPSFFSQRGLMLGSRLNGTDLPTIQRGVAESIRDIAALQRRLQLQQIAEGLRPLTSSPATGSRGAPGLGDLRSRSSELVGRINVVAADLDKNIEQIVEGPLQLSAKFARIRKAIGEDFDPGHPGSLAAAIDSADKTVATLADTSHLIEVMQDAAISAGRFGEAFDYGTAIGELAESRDRLRKAAADSIKGTASTLREAQASLIEQFGKDSASLPPAALARQGGQLFGSAAALARVALGGSLPSGASREGVSLLGTVPPGLEARLGALGAFNFKPESVPALARSGLARVSSLVELNARQGLGPQGISAEAASLRENLEVVRQLINSPEYQKAENVGPETVRTLNDVIDETLFHLKQEVRKSFEALTQVVEQFAGDISGAFKTGISDSLVDIFTNKGQNVRDIARNFGVSIGKAIVDGFVEAVIVRGVINRILNSLLNLRGTPGALPEISLFGGGGTNTGISQEGLLGTLSIADGNAMGALYPRPIAQIPGFAAGVLTRTNGLISTPYGIRRTVEDGTPEAVVPLRGGGLPVRFTNGGGASGPIFLQATMINVVNPGQILADGVSSRPGVVVNEVARDMRGRGVTSKTVRTLARRGG